MNYLVAGVGNACKSVASLFNHLGHNVIITDLKEITVFKSGVLRILLQMENNDINESVFTNEDFSKIINDFIQYGKLILEMMSETFITNHSCFDMANTQRYDRLYHSLCGGLDFKCTITDEFLTIGHGDNKFTLPLYMMGYFFENSAATSAFALTYGIKESYAIDILSVLGRLSAHIVDVKDYKVIFDSTFLYYMMKITIKEDNSKNTARAWWGSRKYG